LLSGGAGSGKTYALVQLINQLFAENPSAKIACITYTNAAAEEIKTRLNGSKLSVGTIHEFLWKNIRLYQRELKACLTSLIEEGAIKGIGAVSLPENCEIQYKEYDRIGEGIISHDKLLTLAMRMFEDYPKLCDILKDKYDFIFFDEYQDTSPRVNDVFLKSFPRTQHKNIIGFFGDTMQSIYDDSIGSLKEYVAAGCVYEVQKKQNRRNPRLVYELANRLRTDGLIQKHSNDPKAPNMQGNGKVKEGDIKFYYSEGDKTEELKIILGWDFASASETKELRLTHNLIAAEAGFPNLMDIYAKDEILAYRKRITDCVKGNSIVDDFSQLSFKDVIERLKACGFAKEVTPTSKQKEFICNHEGLWQIALSCPYGEFRTLSVDKDKLLDAGTSAGSKQDALIAYLFKLKSNIELYTAGDYNTFIRNTDFRIHTIADKKQLRDNMERLKAMSEASIEEVINYADTRGICRQDDKLSEFIQTKSYIYNQVKQVKFRELQAAFAYVNENSPFSTQHKVKGTEFDNVLVILDNGRWNRYNFSLLFETDIAERQKDVAERTRKLFYVCITRTKERLVVYYPNMPHEILAGVKAMFGEDHVHVI